jgi:hypothetical protein
LIRHRPQHDDVTVFLFDFCQILHIADHHIYDDQRCEELDSAKKKHGDNIMLRSPIDQLVILDNGNIITGGYTEEEILLLSVSTCYNIPVIQLLDNKLRTSFWKLKHIR